MISLFMSSLRILTASSLRFHSGSWIRRLSEACKHHMRLKKECRCSRQQTLVSQTSPRPIVRPPAEADKTRRGPHTSCASKRWPNSAVWAL